jgi:predicted ferric reductase
VRPRAQRYGGLVHATRARFVAREVGPTTIVVLVVAQAVLWIVARPAGQPTGSYVGQLLGAEAILLLSIGLVLISTLPWVEEWFDGIDRAAIWHRRVAITGLVLLLPHLLLSSNPHGTALGGPLAVVGAIGMVALAAWAILPRWRSVVPSRLRGLVVAARDAPVIRDVRGIFGDYTSRLRELIEPGMPAVIGGPHGRFSHWKGTDQQVWIAGGVGVAPFLSWVRALDGHLPHRVDFFYSAAGEAPFAAEIRAIAERHDSLQAHLIDTGVEGRLTAESVLAVADGDRSGLSVFMCGPREMLRSLQTQLRLAGVPAKRIHREYFDWR